MANTLPFRTSPDTRSIGAVQFFEGESVDLTQLPPQERRGRRGIPAQQWTELEASRDTLQETLPIYRQRVRERPDVYAPYLATTLSHLGQVQRCLGELRAAHDSYQEALQTFRRLAEEQPGLYRVHVAATLSNLSTVQRDLQDLVGAQESFQEALQASTDFARQPLEVDIPAGAMAAGNSPAESSRPDSSSSFLEHVKAGSSEAWNRLIEVYNPVVARWCRRGGLQDADVDNVRQEVWVAVQRHLPGFRRDQGSGSFHAWLWTITRNKILDHLRRQAKQPPPEGGSDHQDGLSQIPDPAADSSSSSLEPKHAVLRRILDLARLEFEDRTWQAFWRSYIDDQQIGDIAHLLGMTRNAVRLAKSRVLRRLRQLRQELGEILD